jgi:hypothetical protein
MHSPVIPVGSVVQRPIARGRRRLAPLVLTAGLCAAALPADARPLTARRLERPAAQKGLPSSTSYVQRSVSLTAAGSAEFDFFVDSEEEHDFFDFEVDGVVKFRASGSNRGGSAKVPLTIGAHQLRFVYTKDAQGSEGADTAWVGRLSILQGNQVLETHAFGDRPLGAAAGFQSAGTGGGFRVTAAPRKRALRRPTAGAFTGYQPAHTISSIQRTIEWPSGSHENNLLLSFYIDSEESFDFLRVYVDGQERFATSGRDRTGRQRINVGAAGSHTIEIAYDKDPSVDAGTDDARVLDFQATSEFGTVQLGGFDSPDLDSLPLGWSTGPHATSGLTFGVGHEPAARIYAESSTSPLEPEVDGMIIAEYERQSIVKLPNLADATSKPGELWLETQTTGKRFLALRVPKGTATAAGLTLLVDQERNATLSGKGCGPHGTSPDPLDRSFQIDFDAGLGEAASITQLRGACAAGPSAWAAVPDGAEWVIEASASEPAEDPGFLHVEVKMVPPAEATVGDWGLGLAWDRGGVHTNLPRHEDAPPQLDDAASWETIRYAPLAELPRVSLLSTDGRPERGEE